MWLNGIEEAKEERGDELLICIVGNKSDRKERYLHSIDCHDFNKIFTLFS